MRVVVAIVMLAGVAFADVPTRPAPRGFAAYPGARQLCYQHVSSPTMHIMWSTHATRDALAKVVTHYELALGKRAKAEAHGAKRIEIDADRHVTIYPVASEAKLPTCETKAKLGEQTIVMLSTVAR